MMRQVCIENYLAHLIFYISVEQTTVVDSSGKRRRNLLYSVARPIWTLLPTTLAIASHVVLPWVSVSLVTSCVSTSGVC